MGWDDKGTGEGKTSPDVGEFLTMQRMLILMQMGDVALVSACANGSAKAIGCVPLYC